MTRVPLRDIERFNKSRDTLAFPATALTSISELSASSAVSRNISRNQRTREPKEKAQVRYLNRTVLCNEFSAWPSEQLIVGFGVCDDSACHWHCLTVDSVDSDTDSVTDR